MHPDHIPQIPLSAIPNDSNAEELPPIIPISRASVKDLTGMVFGQLLVIGFVGTNQWKKAMWLCRCDCGQYRTICRSGLLNGTTQSCGCLKIETTIRRNTAHGKSNSPEYKTWCAMITRCENPNQPSFKDYGARGITICERWRHSFENFLNDMGAKPGPRYSIERINNDAGYCPENCRWATKHEQMNNTTRSIYLEFQGERLTLGQWAKKLHIHHEVLYWRVRAGWDVERTLTTPANPHD